MIAEKDFHKFPLCIDLDGTLWDGDCLWLSAKLFLKKSPWKILNLIIWWSQDRTVLKHNLVKNIGFEPIHIDFYEPILEYVKALKANGAKLYLITGSDQIIADAVAKHLGIFEQAFGSSIKKNMVGHNKTDILNNLFVKHQYIYFGNEWKDRLVWQNSAAAVAVNVSKRTKNWLKNSGIYTKYFKC